MMPFFAIFIPVVLLAALIAAGCSRIVRARGRYHFPNAQRPREALQLVGPEPASDPVRSPPDAFAAEPDVPGHTGEIRTWSENPAQQPAAYGFLNAATAVPMVQVERPAALGTTTSEWWRWCRGVGRVSLWICAATGLIAILIFEPASLRIESAGNQVRGVFRMRPFLTGPFESETRDGAPAAAISNPEPDAAAEEPEARGPFVMLTFDDGPGPDTAGILDALSASDHAPASFFVVGERIPGRAAVLQRLIAEGHVLGNHTITHLDLGKATPAQIAREITGCSEAIFRAVGQRPVFFRPPYGAKPWNLSDVLKENALMLLLWNVDVNDWQSSQWPAGTDPQLFIESVMHGIDEQIREGRDAVVLLHEQSVITREALPGLLKEIRSRNLPMATVAAQKKNRSAVTNAVGPNNLKKPIAGLPASLTHNAKPAKPEKHTP